jgi:hypothetical protein
MTITVGGSNITFNDATTQSTAPVNTNANVNSVSAGTGISVNQTTGALTVTNAGVTSVAAGTGISVSASTGGVTISASGGGTVSSVATGNGLQGGTITTSGTLSVACPTAWSVGSYAAVGISVNLTTSISAGSNYSAGTGIAQIQTGIGADNGGNGMGAFTYNGNTLSGTWKWLGSSKANNQLSDGSTLIGIACRVS